MRTDPLSSEISVGSRWSLRGFLALSTAAILVPTAFAIWQNSCLRRILEQRWLPSGAPPLVANNPEPGGVVIENPYGIISCDYFPGTWETIFNNSMLAAFFFGIGFLALRLVRTRPLLSAAGIGWIGMSFQFVLTLLAYPDALTFDVTPGDEIGEEFVRSIQFEFFKYWVIASAIAAFVCVLGAAYAVWRRPLASQRFDL